MHPFIIVSKEERAIHWSMPASYFYIKGEIIYKYSFSKNLDSWLGGTNYPLLELHSMITKYS